MRLRVFPLLAIVLLMMIPAALLLYTVGFSDRSAEEGVPSSSRAPTEPPRDDRLAPPSTSRPAEPSRGSTRSDVGPPRPSVPSASAPSGSEPRPGPGAVVTGRVLDPRGQPLGGVPVRLVRATSSVTQLEQLFGLPPSPRARTLATTRTGADGGFRLEGLDPEAEQSVEIRRKPYAPLTRRLEYLEQFYPAPLRLGDLRLTAGAVIEGTCVDPEGRPLEAVALRVEAGPLAEARPGAAHRSMIVDPAAPDAVTDARGTFRIEGAPSGDVRIHADHRDRVAGVSPVLRTAPGRTTSGVRIVLRPGRVIAGFVKSPAGRALPGIEVFAVRLERSTAPDSRAGRGGSVRTDAEGRFEIRGLDAGPYRVSAWAPGRSPVGVETVAGRRDVNLVFEAPRVFRIRGRVVVKGEGRPIEGATVRLANAYVGGAGPRGDADAFTDADGRFELAAEETWTRQVVTADAAGFVRGRSAAFGLSREVPAPPEIVLHLEPGSGLEGRVTAARDARPVNGAAVVLWRSGPDPRASGRWISAPDIVSDSGRALARTRTDETGRFRFACVPPGRHDLEVRHVEFADAIQEGLVLTSGETLSGIEVTLGRGGALSGKVFFRDGGPAARVAVVLRDRHGREKRRVTRQDGAFRFTHLAAGRHVAFLVEPGQAGPPPLPVGVQQLGAGSSSPAAAGNVIDVTEDSEVVRDFTIDRGTRVEGRVLSAGNGVSGCSVTLHPRRPRRSPVAAIDPGGGVRTRTTESEAHGRFVLENVKPGRYEAVVRVRESPLSYEALKTPLDVPPASPFRVDLEVPSGRIEGRVLLPGDSAPAEGIRLRLNRTDGKERYVRVGRTGAGGVYAFGHVAAGTYEVVVPGGPDWAVASRGEIVLSHGARLTDIDIHLEAGVDVEGVVVDGEGRPVAAARVRVVPVGNDPSRWGPPARARTGADGRFTLRRIPPGSYTFRAFKRREHSDPVRVAVPAAGKLDHVRLVLPRGGGK